MKKYTFAVVGALGNVGTEMRNILETSDLPIGNLILMDLAQKTAKKVSWRTDEYTVIEAKAGVSRLVSLLPPIHVAVALKGQVVAGLDELFVLRRNDYLTTGVLSYANIITGPSRSADIDQTLVKGMHGPKEVHMIMVEKQD